MKNGTWPSTSTNTISTKDGSYSVDDLPAGYSSFWINTVLRQKLNYRGTIFSDDLGMFAARTAGNLVDRVRDSLAAGCDSALICDPDDVRGLLAEHDEAFADADAAIRRLKGRFTASRDEIEQVSEWQQWKHSIKQRNWSNQNGREQDT